MVKGANSTMLFSALMVHYICFGVLCLLMMVIYVFMCSLIY